MAHPKGPPRASPALPVVKVATRPLEEGYRATPVGGSGPKAWSTIAASNIRSNNGQPIQFQIEPKRLPEKKAANIEEPAKSVSSNESTTSETSNETHNTTNSQTAGSADQAAAQGPVWSQVARFRTPREIGGLVNMNALEMQYWGNMASQRSAARQLLHPW
ncbi:hypothetical protein V8F20_011846 [Naviculisporaceae sp. PSN 640]